MEPVFQKIPLSSNDRAADEALINEINENTLRYKSFNKHEVKYLYNTLISNCAYFLETTYESIYSTSYTFDHQEFHTFAEEAIRKAGITIPLLYSIMYYIKRFRDTVRKNPKVIMGLHQGISIKEPRDLYKIFITAAVLSLKFFNDRVILNVEWTKFLKNSVAEINLCERQFFKFIGYNLDLNSKNYYTFINDYLNKFNNNSALPIKSYSTPVFSSSSLDKLSNRSTINNRLSQPNMSIKNIFITPTPSIGSQASPNNTTNNNTNNEKPLTPNDVYMETAQPRAMYDDPMNVDMSKTPQKQQQMDICRNDTQRTLCNDVCSVANLTRNDTQRTLCNDMSGFNSISRNDTQRTLCNDMNGFTSISRNDTQRTLYNEMTGINSISRNDTQRTLCNENMNINGTPEFFNDNKNISPNGPYSSYSPNNEYHPSEDAVLREHLNTNADIPLNKLLYNLHHYHNKNNQQNTNLYSSMQSIPNYN